MEQWKLTYIVHLCNINETVEVYLYLSISAFSLLFSTWYIQAYTSYSIGGIFSEVGEIT